MAVIRLETLVPAGVVDVLTMSLDLDVELMAGSGWHAKAVAGGVGFRTSGVIGRGEIAASRREPATVMLDEVSWKSPGPLALLDGTLGRRTLLGLLARRNEEILRRLSS